MRLPFACAPGWTSLWRISACDTWPEHKTDFLSAKCSCQVADLGCVLLKSNAINLFACYSCIVVLQCSTMFNNSKSKWNTMMGWFSNFDSSRLFNHIEQEEHKISACVRLGNPDSDFAIEREIRKRISPPRNPSSGWISIKKSKCGFHGFPFYRSTGKSEKGFAKLFSWTAVFSLIIMRARAMPLFLRTALQILFRIFQMEG